MGFLFGYVYGKGQIDGPTYSRKLAPQEFDFQVLNLSPTSCCHVVPTRGAAYIPLGPVGPEVKGSKVRLKMNDGKIKSKNKKKEAVEAILGTHYHPHLTNQMDEQNVGPTRTVGVR